MSNVRIWLSFPLAVAGLALSTVLSTAAKSCAFTMAVHGWPSTIRCSTRARTGGLRVPLSPSQRLAVSSLPFTDLQSWLKTQERNKSNLTLGEPDPPSFFFFFWTPVPACSLQCRCVDVVPQCMRFLEHASQPCSEIRRVEHVGRRSIGRCMKSCKRQDSTGLANEQGRSRTLVNTWSPALQRTETAAESMPKVRPWMGLIEKIKGQGSAVHVFGKQAHVLSSRALDREPNQAARYVHVTRVCNFAPNFRKTAEKTARRIARQCLLLSVLSARHFDRPLPGTLYCRLQCQADLSTR